MDIIRNMYLCPKCQDSLLEFIPFMADCGEQGKIIGLEIRCFKCGVSVYAVYPETARLVRGLLVELVEKLGVAQDGKVWQKSFWQSPHNVRKSIPDE